MLQDRVGGFVVEDLGVCAQIRCGASSAQVADRWSVLRLKSSSMELVVAAIINAFG